MAKYKLEYIWLDGYTPVPNLRGKTLVKEYGSLSEARGASSMGVRRQFHAAGGREEFRLFSEAGGDFP